MGLSMGAEVASSSAPANVMEALGHESNGSTAHDDTYVVDGEKVVVLARYTVANKATGEGLAFVSPTTSVVRGGLIVGFEQFTDTAEVRDAMRTS
jgi:ketosteroid isomerase-like protein